MTTSAAQRVLAALAATDTPEPPDDLFAPGAITWHSFDEVEAPTVPDTFASLRAIRAVVPDFTMSDVRVSDADDGVGLARYVITGTLPDGGRLRAPAAMAVVVEGDRVTRLEEYVDTAQLARMFAALG
jgi:ketosteroid isomerase-like protein